MSGRGDRATGAGRLGACPDKPNCVSSRAGPGYRRVAPIGYFGSRAQARAALLATIRCMPRTEILHAEADYVHAVQRSRLFRFVDDLECELPGNERLIHVRSASRSGYYDFGVNRARIDRLRRDLNRRLAEAPADP